jgi:beta-glucanase (GH16 family)
MKTSIVLGFLGVALSAFPGNAAPPSADYKLVWADEFDGKALDTTKWEYRQPGPRRDAINAEDSVALDGDGHLELTTRRVDEKIHTAMIGSKGKYEPRYGFFECRVKLQKQVGHWSAFWLQSPTLGKPVGDSKKAGTEIDIFEYLRREGDKVHHTLHWDGYGKDHKSTNCVPVIQGFGDGWHTVGLLWTPEEYRFYVDDKETWRTGKGISQRSEYIILSLEVGKWAGSIKTAGLPDSLEVDYVRVYQRPQDAQRAVDF